MRYNRDDMPVFCIPDFEHVYSLGRYYSNRCSEPVNMSMVLPASKTTVKLGCGAKRR